MELRRRSARQRQAVLEAEDNSEDDYNEGKQQRRKRSRKGEEAPPIAEEEEEEEEEVEHVNPVQPVQDPLQAATAADFLERTRRLARSKARFYAHYDPDTDDLFDPLLQDDDEHTQEPVVAAKEKVAVNWGPSRVPGDWDVPVSRPPTLFELSLKKLCQNINGLESLEDVSEPVKQSIVMKLWELGKLNFRTSKLVFSASSSSIFFPDCTRLTLTEFKEALSCSNQHMLQALDLRFCGPGLTDDVLSEQRFPQLEKLHIHGAYVLTDASLSEFFGRTRRLSDVRLVECFAITDGSIDALADAVGSDLRELAVERCDAVRVPQLMRSLFRLKGLHSLSLAGMKGVDNQVITEIMVNIGSTLEKLDISGCNVGDDGMASVAACGSGLTTLEIGKLTHTTDLSLVKLSESCHALNKVSLDGSKSYSDKQLAKFFSASGAALCDVSLQNVRNAGDNTLIALAEHAKETLRTLDASFCREMSDEGFGYLADSCSSLMELKIFGCTQVTHKFIMGHSNKSLKILGCWF